MSHRIILYTKPGCHLCEIAHQLLLGLRREFELTFEERDITRDPSLFEKYWDKIPVVLIDDRTTLAAPIRVADVRAALLGKV
ncbi:MAG: glutaredoxin family protein [Chloroflexi bacterium]|nr:glutaredoxin family protein [Chloroflexota bacterium]